MNIDGYKLLELLPGRRWFGAQGRGVKSARVIDQVELDEGPPALVLVIAEIAFREGDRSTYQFPLHQHEDGSLTDAFDDPASLAPLGRALAHGETHHGSRGAFRFGGPGLDPMAPPGTASVRAVGAEQSNSSVVFDEKVILKLIRRLETGPNPELELNRYLTNAGFEHIPAQVGEVFYESSSEEENGDIDLGIAQQFVTDAREGWSYTLDALHALYDSAVDPADISALVEERATPVLDELENLGEVTAALHVVLARPNEAEPGVGAEPIDEWDLKEWAEGAHQWIRGVLRSNATDLRDLGEAIEARIDLLHTTVEDAGLKARIHGDYHLGQVLLAQTRGWLILDFEGEPVRSLEERRQKQSPLRDVAGMLRSLSYAASVALFDRCEADSDEWRRLEPLADAWEEAARDRFLAGYLRTSHEGRFLPADKDALTTMLDAFEIEKALYEVNYELGHRPQWLRIPLRGVAKVIRRGAAR